MPPPEVLRFALSGGMPNHPHLPALLYRGAVAPQAGPAAQETLFARSGWPPQWRDGVYDFQTAVAGAMPPFISQWIADGNDDAAIPVLSLLMSVNTQIRWALRNGMWVMGADSGPDLARAFRRYTLAGVADRITAPALVLDAENDQFLKGEPARVAEATRQLGSAGHSGK